MKYTLEDKMTSLRAVSIAVLLYIFGYSLKISVLLNGILETRIPNTVVRFVTSGVMGAALSTALLIVSVIEIKKYTSYIIAIMDAIMLLLVFNVFNSNGKSELFTLVFISLFTAFIGFNLISVFVVKYQLIKSGKEQSISQLEQIESKQVLELSKIEQEIAEKKQTTCEHCLQEYGTRQALNAHKGRCIKNPKNL
ncbi:hypothetical protein [Tenacibaculum caenipelagi]|uniref:Uncharacterized protein n=1 Tax=Tenacibaculum caenipelagi TaxID=1325435 RepID=A0A4R6TB98_9FLAO|nr:hypothetical protein [Tenacibaculum caenipelagi]TDQ22774.1 hypothetical protein DFQ07_2792 [Tenacibaculum caenipelagi]